MKLKLTLGQYADLELQALDLACDSPHETFDDEDIEGVHYVVRYPHLVIPRLGVEFRNALVYDDSVPGLPVEYVNLMYKRGEKNPGRYICISSADDEYTDVLKGYYTPPEGGFENEEVFVNLDEFITKRQLGDKQDREPELEIWNYITFD